MVPQSHRRVMLNRGRTAAPVSACVTRCIERKNKSLRIFLISDQHFKNVGCLSLKCKKKKARFKYHSNISIGASRICDYKYRVSGNLVFIELFLSLSKQSQ